MNDEKTGTEILPSPAILPGKNQEQASWSFAGDQVMRQTAEYPVRVRDAARWLYFYCRDHNIAQKRASDAIGYSPNTVYRVLQGTYEGSLDKVAESIEAYKHICDERQGLDIGAFVETSTSKKIWQICEAAHAYQSMAVIYGDSQIGKTTALEEYARRHNHGQTRYVRMPAASGVQYMMKCMAEACGISPKCAFEALRKRVADATDENTLWLIDELHQCFATYQTHSRVSALEIIRELHDRSQCGMVLCGTNIARQEIENGQHKIMLEQLRRRSIFQLQLPKYATWADRVAIARSFSLDAPTGDTKDLVDKIIREKGLRAFTAYLRASGKLAAKRQQPVCWDHFIAAHDAIAKLSHQTKEEAT